MPSSDASTWTAPTDARDRLWELSSNLHCSIIGTCLSTADLRSVLAKLGEPAARTASDHDLHGRAVSRAGRREGGAKVLHKLLDRKHAREVARFDKAATTEAVRALWREAVARGEIPGAYWAVLTHPFTDHRLVQEVFGEVHMLSHLVGRSVRADLRRLAQLEEEVGARDAVIAEQEARIRALTEDKGALTRALAARETEIREPAGPADSAPVIRQQEEVIAALRERAGRAEAHAAALAERRAELERAAALLAEEVRAAAEREEALRSERDALEAELARGLDDDAGLPRPLVGQRLLYVGGRPRQVAQVRRLVERRGGILLAHDGGVEESATLLPGLVARADLVLFPVDCVSHDAAGTVKRCCREADKRFVALRSASLAGVLSVIAAL
ncbi:hypothetical protein VQ02_02340 [Methylobacterium variabile]|uniref:Uncharacterized protein n=1 Tax=Methylobacterium variabile TaxID=298794 RepID=A0A0J6TA64_9HYPH|nr:hypothetical protein VQ02_02340 [Methylobacterium variabile]